MDAYDLLVAFYGTEIRLIVFVVNVVCVHVLLLCTRASSAFGGRAVEEILLLRFD